VDLYLYDFKTIERLTDVTFERLVASDKYAAVLFTIECKYVGRDLNRENKNACIFTLECLSKRRYIRSFY